MLATWETWEAVASITNKRPCDLKHVLFYSYKFLGNKTKLFKIVSNESGYGGLGKMGQT